MNQVRQFGSGRFIATWGPIIGFVGGLIGVAAGGLSLVDRFYPPSVDVLDLIPVYISEPKTILGARGAIRGVGVLLHVRARNRSIPLTGLELVGKRCVSFGEFLGFLEPNGKTDQDLEAEFKRLRPFQHVSFFGWPTDHAGPISLAAWEESFIRFTFLDPGLDSPGLLIDRRYFGSQQQPPALIRRYGFNVLEMFTLAASEQTSWTAGHLRNEILDGAMVFRVLAGGIQFNVSTNALRGPKRLTPEDWKKGDLAPLLSQQFPSLEAPPTKENSTSCYE